MPATTIDEYLAAVPEPGRTTLQSLRELLRTLLPEATEDMSYGAPAFRMKGKAVAGFSASKAHLTYLPHSGAILERMAGRLTGYGYAKGSLRFPLDEELPTDLVKDLVAARLAELG